ncbi:hypothetical protein [Haloterrigena salifodinae]|uniref:hypothetical protein n=1 Tax=Haloterrigena salifodinae TaxID=2675099 RepID=UPI002013679C|nr:hypothetical protein [Haloterrigena salifodinae]
MRRATLHGYLLLLVGLLFVVEATVALTAGVSSAELGGLVFGLFGVGAGVLVSLEPRRVPRGMEPAPTSLCVIAAVATLGFVVAVIGMTIA